MNCRGLSGRATAVVLSALALLAGCGSGDKGAESAPATITSIRVSEVALGKAVDTNNKVTLAATRFASSDTIHVSVVTEGSADQSTLMLMVMSLADSSYVYNENRSVPATKSPVLEFSLSNPVVMKVGSYRADIFLNGVLAEIKHFEVVSGG
jgi:hypothetical protein